MQTMPSRPEFGLQGFVGGEVKIRRRRQSVRIVSGDDRKVRRPIRRQRRTPEDGLLKL
jgi:hypothetical protein